MKKLLLASSLMVSSSVMATGFYAGGQVGMSSLNANAESSTAEVEYGDYGAQAGLYAGYRFDMDGLFISGELTGNLNNTKGEVKSGSDSAELKQGNAIGIHVLAGIPIGQDTEVYGRLGLEKAKFEAESKSGSTSTDFDESEKGTVLGLGMQHHLDNNLAVRFDYKFVKYKEFKFADNGSDFKITDQLFSVGVQYSF